MNPIKIMLFNAIALALWGSGLMQSTASPGRGSSAVSAGSAKGPATDTGLGCANSANGVTSISCTINDVPAGQMILVNYTAFTNNFSSLTDSNSGTVSIIPSYPVSFAGAWDYIIVITNTGAGTHVLTVKENGNTSYPTLIADLISGASPTAPIENVNHFTGTTKNGSASTFACGEVTATQPGELLVSFANVAGASPTLTAVTSPQPMTISQSGAPNAKSAYGPAATIGTNVVKWNVSFGPNSYGCDTVAVHS